MVMQLVQTDLLTHECTQFLIPGVEVLFIIVSSPAYGNSFSHLTFLSLSYSILMSSHITSQVTVSDKEKALHQHTHKYNKKIVQVEKKGKENKQNKKVIKSKR